jgi:hypothetical protein
MDKRFIAVAAFLAAGWISVVSAVLWVIYWK